MSSLYDQDGVLIAAHDRQERDKFVNDKALEYLQRHPNVKIRYAKRQARMRWARKVKKHVDR